MRCPQINKADAQAAKKTGTVNLLQHIHDSFNVKIKDFELDQPALSILEFPVCYICL